MTMVSEASPSQFIELDPRRRTTIRAGEHDRYRVTELPGGALLLQPVFVLTEDEIILRNHPELEARMERSLRDPALRTKRGRPTPKE